MRPKWTVEQDGRHAVELEVHPDAGVVALYRYTSPVGRARYYVEVAVSPSHFSIRTDRYIFTAEVFTPTGGRPLQRVSCAFIAASNLDAGDLARNFARLWATGRVPLTPGGSRDAAKWRSAVDNLADALLARRMRTIGSQASGT